MIVGKALRLAGRALEPAAHLLPAEHVAGVALRDAFAVVVVVAACFVAGLIARTGVGTRANDRLERAVLGRVPGYTLLKRAAEGLVGLESHSEIGAALARIEDAWVPAFVVETHADGLLTVFVPSAPTPAAGSIYHLLEAARVRRLDVSVAAMSAVVMRLGVGMRELIASSTPARPSGAERM